MFVKFAKIKNVKGYQISYSTNKTFKKAKKVTVSSNSKTIKKLKSKKMYYVRVRAIRKNKQKTLYGAWSAKKKVKIKKSLINNIPFQELTMILLKWYCYFRKRR